MNARLKQFSDPGVSPPALRRARGRISRDFSAPLVCAIARACGRADSYRRAPFEANIALSPDSGLGCKTVFRSAPPSTLLIDLSSWVV